MKFFLTLIFSVVILLVSQNALAQGPRLGAVVVVYSYNSSIPWQRLFNKGFSNKLYEYPGAPVVFEENLDAGRLDIRQHQDNIIHYLKRKYAGQKIALVVTESSEAALLLSEHQELFQGIPRLYINPSTAVSVLTEQEAVIRVKEDIPEAVRRVIETFKPDRLTVVGETQTLFTNETIQSIRNAEPSFDNTVAVDYLLDLPMGELERKVSELPRNSIIFYPLIFRDGKGEQFVPYEAAKRITDVANSPVFSHWDSLVGSGIAGGYLLSAEHVGEIVADNVMQYMYGQNLRNTGSDKYTPFITLYDWEILSRYDINTDNIPANAKLINLPPPLYIAYRNQIIVGALALAFLALTIAIWIAALKRKLNIKVLELTKTGDKLKQHIAIVDRHVITSSTDPHGRITEASQAFADISGYSKEELIGKSHNIIRHPDVPKEVYRELWATIKNGGTWKGEFINKNKAGDSYWVSATIEPDWDNNGEIVGYTAIREDITDKKRIEELSITDKLTSLFNRQKIDSALIQEFNRVARYGDSLSIIMVDIDKFKNVNDTYGHQAGDRVLTDVATILKTNVRSTDLPGRWGGEEFLILCPETDGEGARLLAEKIRNCIAEHNFSEVGHLTASFGVSTHRSSDTQEDLIRRADEALYTAKEKGRNRVETEKK